MRSWLVIAGLFFAVVMAVLPLNAQVNVKQHHNHDSRDGLYVDPAFTQSNAASLTRDLSFDGTVIWQRNDLGASVPLNQLPCGNINPMGVTGTPVVDLTSRSLFFDAMTTPDGGTTKKHLIYSLNVDTGAVVFPVGMRVKRWQAQTRITPQALLLADAST
jgi:hypothetical protein